MKRNRWTSRGAGSIALVPAAVMAFALTEGAVRRPSIADDTATSAAHPSSSDPDHLWNRIRHRFHVRLQSQRAQAPDNLTFNQNEHDPLLWLRVYFPEPADYLLKGAAHHEALALLDEFLTRPVEKLESNPLQRALLQHDLWAVFDFASDPGWLERVGRQPERKRYRSERRELYQRLAKAIDRLALTNEEIDELPDNYAAAIADRQYPATFDPQNPDQAFLPSDLWQPQGPWVQLRDWVSNPLAIRHATFFGGRSVFTVFLRLPEGRAATLKYLEELRAWKSKAGQTVPPQVPPQTQLALAKRMMVVNIAGQLVATRLVEMVQVRAVRDPLKRDGEGQTFLEYRLRRQKLIDGKGGGLSLVQQDERDRSDLLSLACLPEDEKRVPIMSSCPSCHRGQGILSVNSFTGQFDNVSSVRGYRTLVDSTNKDQEDATLRWKRKQYSWGLLNGLNDRKSRTDP